MRELDLVNITVPFEVAVASLRGHPKVRLQILCEPMDRRQSRWDRTDVLTVGVVDTETTGLDSRVERMMELAVQQISIDAKGRIVTTGKPFGWLEYPGKPIPPDITLKTGITDEMVAGKEFPEGEAFSALSGVDVLLSHNAAFDRPFIEARFPGVKGKPWICSLRDLDWKARGFPKLGLEDLLWKCGWFFHQAHRATADVSALLHLLDHKFVTDEYVLGALWKNALKPNFLVRATGAAKDKRLVLKSNGYAWSGTVWWKYVAEEALPEERAWLAANVYGSGFSSEPTVTQVTWKERYTAVE